MLGKHFPIDEISDPSAGNLCNQCMPSGLAATYGFAINPVALQLLNAKLPNGNFLIPTPTSANGTYTGTTPSVFNENQFNANFDYRFDDNNTLSIKSYFSNAPLICR